MTDRPQDWDQLASDWQQQPVPRIDVDRLRREAEKQGRWLRWSIALEILLAVMVVLLCAYIALLHDATALEKGLFIGLAVFIVVYQALVVRMRRRDLVGGGRDALSLLELESRRCRSTLAYWRWGMWSGLALWGVLYGLFLGGIVLGWEGPSLRGLAGGLGLNVLLFPLIGVYGFWRSRGARRRLAHLGELRAQLLDD